MTAQPRAAGRPALCLRLGAPLFALALRLLGATWRVQLSGSNPLDATNREAAGGAPIGIAWHAGALVFAHFFRDRDITIGVSRSRDGESVSAVLERLGFAPPVRGSTSSGGAEALRRLIARAREDRPVALLVDGPRGPAERAKPGAALLSQKTGRALTPLGCDARPAIRFGSWDRTLLPLPFARVAIHFGEPLPPAGAAAETEATSLDRALDAAQRAAARALGDPVDA